MTRPDREDELFTQLVNEADQPFSGWDFSYLKGRWVEPPIKWSYEKQVRAKMKNAAVMLDMDTGGGERLARLQPLPPKTYATEAYAANIPIAEGRLRPLGVEVVGIANEDNSDLPFADETFDLILNRHGAYSPPELRRILKQGGYFLTQQVGYRDLIDLLERFGARHGFYEEYWQRSRAEEELAAAGLEIVEALEDTPIGRIYDVGAIVYFLKAIPWTLPDFTVERYDAALREIHRAIQRDGYVEMTIHRFFICAVKRFERDAYTAKT